MAGLVKDSTASLDLSQLPKADTSTLELHEKCKQRRTPPLLPDEFERRLASKSFTSKKSDLPTVAALYRTAFEEHVRETKFFIFEGMGWADAEAVLVAQLIQSGILSGLVRVSLKDNRIGDEGARALGDALDAETAEGWPVSQNLRNFDLRGNPVSPDILARFDSEALKARYVRHLAVREEQMRQQILERKAMAQAQKRQARGQAAAV